jgi:hypothetical protein
MLNVIQYTAPRVMSINEHIFTHVAKFSIAECVSIVVL